MAHRLSLYFVLIPFVFAAGCSDNGGTSDAAKLQANKQVVIQAAEYINARDYESLKAVIAEDYLRHSQATPGINVSSFDEFVTFLKEGAVPFPDDKAIWDALVAEGDLVAFRGRYEGTNTGPGPFPTTGKAVSLEMAGIHRIEDGKIAETWITWDNVEMFSQLGFTMVPQMGTPEAQE